MRHCVFGASVTYGKLIDEVFDLARMLEGRWDVEHDVVLCAFHSNIVYTKDDLNAEVYLENDDVHQLITDCMEFAVEYSQLKNKIGKCI